MNKISELELKWNKRATADAARILDYVSEQDANAAHKLIDEIEQKVEALQGQPRMGREGRVAGTRELVVHRNYIVVYKVDPKKVVVLRVRHAKQMWPI